MLTTEAFNALLKTLEEPPAHVKFIFATTAPHKLPATILSRCQRFDFRRIPVATIVEVLGTLAKAEHLQVEAPALYAIARIADGSLRDAEVILEQLASFAEGPIREADVMELIGTIESDALAHWTQAILGHDVAKALTGLRDHLDRGREPAQLLSALLQHLRNLVVARATAQAPSRDALVARLIDESSEHRRRLIEQADELALEELLWCLQVLTGAL
jgi:DNA polymerase-3 subunit gamma/tau